MTTITILPEKEDSYRALAGDKESIGRTAGEALDGLTSQLSDDENGTLVIVQNHKADEFFDTTQQQRLTELMHLRQARILSSEEEQELENLIEAELDGARRRTAGKALRQRIPKEGSGLTEHEIQIIKRIKEALELSDADVNVISVSRTLKRVHLLIKTSLSQKPKIDKG
jgi:hypothetical protein